MALVRIGGNLANKVIILALDPDTMPASVAPYGTITSLGTFEHSFGPEETDDAIPGTDFGPNHTFMEHVWENLRLRSASNLSTAKTALEWPDAIVDIEDWKVEANGLFLESTGIHTKNPANRNIGAVAATGDIVFSAQPAAGSSITINGTEFGFVASGATGNQINIAASLTLTIDAIVTKLNASVVAGVAVATYSAVGGTTLHVVFDTAGPTGEDFTLVASTSPASHGTVSDATLNRVGPTATLVTKHLPGGSTIAVAYLNFESDNEDVATVSSVGVVTAVSEGVARIRVTRKDGRFDDIVNEARVKVI